MNYQKEFDLACDKIVKLEEQNKKLKAENKELKKKVETLEMWLDNKEKLNEEYRKKIDKFKTDIIYEEGLYE